MNAHTDITAAVPQVYSAISDVMAVMAKEGISKDRRNGQQGYNFRGIDDVFNALSSVMAEKRLVMLPFVQDRQREERQTKSGGSLTYTILTVDFTLVSAGDGSSCVVRTEGEAMDSADKSTNKAMSAALKYAALMVFMIPTEGDNDADATTHEVQPRAQQQAGSKPASVDDIEPAGGWGDWTRDLIKQVKAAKSDAELDAIRDDPINKPRINATKKVDNAMNKAIAEAFKERRAALADPITSDEVPY